MSSPAPVFAWTDAFKLGYERMDETHRDFVLKVNALLVAEDASLLARLDDFVAHAEAHFGEEAQWMTATDFPAAQCHIDEHDAVMKSVLEVRGRLAAQPDAKYFAITRSLAQELMRWFPGHADYLDSALSHWMVKRVYGGAPIVFRRS
ncbi:MAG: hemerythrin-like metal-binding protein [Hydrocarboniphaga sp.]|uniref:hemerythrin domain-containing protein n=1 Tax=Hydrocarboniphaga sp. TaxID=2033016 RepID=UPI002624B293|nr:hemerythrin domain-containing protein [Hydrocarboniphaga sp.]MDB5973108.1 hemerythrin-like metal-binding protein [Hydrocarboniphaga sp.]